MRLERAWGLAIMLHRRGGSSEAEHESHGGKVLLRGFRYFVRQCENIAGKKNVGTDFKVLARQSTYGMLGIYANVASRLGFIDIDDYGLTPRLGVSMAEAFLEHTLPGGALHEIKRLALDHSATVRVELLQKWGKRCHDAAGWPSRAAQCVKSGLTSNPDRIPALQVLSVLHEGWDGGETELELLNRARELVRHGSIPSLSTADTRRLELLFEASIALEEAYRWTSVVLERLLWLAGDPRRQSNAGGVGGDDVLRRCHEQIGCVHKRLRDAHAALKEHGLYEQVSRMQHAVYFVEAAAKSKTPLALADEVLERHRQVQHGKFDRGRRKLPWVERRGDRVVLTASRAGGQRGVVTRPEQIPLHAWRLYPAMRYLNTFGGAL